VEILHIVWWGILFWATLYNIILSEHETSTLQLKASFVTWIPVADLCSVEDVAVMCFVVGWWLSSSHVLFTDGDTVYFSAVLRRFVSRLWREKGSNNALFLRHIFHHFTATYSVVVSWFSVIHALFMHHTLCELLCDFVAVHSLSY